MTGSKRARSKPSVTNKTSIFGIMGGLTPMTTNVNGYGNERKNSGKSFSFLYNRSINYQRDYLFNNKIVSVNPQCSGGVGKRNLLMKCNSSNSSEPTTSSSEPATSSSEPDTMKLSGNDNLYLWNHQPSDSTVDTEISEIIAQPGYQPIIVDDGTGILTDVNGDSMPELNLSTDQINDIKTFINTYNLNAATGEIGTGYSIVVVGNNDYVVFFFNPSNDTFQYQGNLDGNSILFNELVVNSDLLYIYRKST